jgi:hypothetical protein
LDQVADRAWSQVYLQVYWQTYENLK